MKLKLTITTFLFACIVAFSQENEKSKLLEIDTFWGVEHFTFPIGFAQELTYKGTEEAIFPKGWNKVDGDFYWSYIFVWNIDLDREITEKELEANLQIYFDGLMKGRMNNVSFEKTNALFLKTHSEKEVVYFKGKINAIEGFYTKEPFTMNVQVEQHLCSVQKKSVILFRFSPKDFDSKTWEKLKSVELQSEVCDVGL